jgi:hypothetical protein
MKPSDLDLELMQQADRPVKLDVSEVKRNILKLVIRKILGRNSDEIILSQSALQPRGDQR